MTLGHDLTNQSVRWAISYNQRRFGGDAPFLQTLCSNLGLPSGSAIDEAFVRFVATWQERNIARGAGDGAVGPRTEAHLNILVHEAERVVAAAEHLLMTENILFDSWRNDMRDNDGDGTVDGPEERAPDGSHYGRSYSVFNVRKNSYVGGWDLPEYGFPRRTVHVLRDRTLRGTFRYAVCADIVSEIYARVGIMRRTRSTGRILQEFRRIGYVWRRSEGYPSEYLPGDFICTWAPGGGHSGVVVAGSPTGGGRNAPLVIELPGPSSQVSDGTYDPANTTDVVRHRWSSFRLTAARREDQYLGRLLHTRLRGRR